MGSSFSNEIANASLMEIDTKISISPNEFVQCLSSVSSYSEKTLLVLAFLSTVEGKPELNDYIQKIKQNFITQNFTEINRLIKEIIVQPNNFIEEASLQKWKEALHNLNDSFSKDIVYSDNQDTSSRRIFESVLAQRYLANDNTLIDFQRYYGNIRDPESLSKYISKTLFEEKRLETDEAWVFWRTHWLRIDTKLDRGRGNPKENDSLPQVRTPGVLKYTTPRPMYMYDREISFKGVTSQSDKNRSVVNPRNPNWVQQNPENPFVASFSGHTVFFIGLLIADSKKVAANERQNFFNTMMKAYISVYLSQGFHSFKEISDMVRDPEIVESLKKVGIEVNLEQLFEGSDGILDKTFADSIEYNKNYLLKKSTLESLKEKSQENSAASDFIDPRESFLIEKAKQKNIEHSKEISAGNITLEEIQLREKLFSGDITPIQALRQMPESKLIFNIALSVDPQLLDSLNIQQVNSLYQKGFFKNDIMIDKLMRQKVNIKTSKDGFWKSDNALKDEEKNSLVKQNLCKLQMACLNNDASKINSAAIALFKSAGAVRSAFDFRDFSSNTSSAQSLLTELQKPANAYILKALKINPKVKSTDVNQALVDMMEKAFENKNVIPVDKPALPPRHNSARKNP